MIFPMNDKRTGNIDAMRLNTEWKITKLNSICLLVAFVGFIPEQGSGMHKSSIMGRRWYVRADK